MTLTKNIFRDKCIEKMQKASKYNKIYKDELLNRQIMAVIDKIAKNKKPLDILFYYPLPNEANIVKSLKKLRKKHHIYLPFMEGKSFKMVPFRLPLKKKKFGILEAGNSLKYIRKIDIAIVPVVGVDGNFQRIGYGKGMYDRFFETLKIQPYTIFVQAQLCYTDKSLCDKYDISCDVIVTPEKTLQKRLL
jgi:5-formyltetrahydrofolate cyclo-ligase